MARKEKGFSDPAVGGGFNSPIAGLAGLKAALPSAPVDEAPAEAAANPEASAARSTGPARAVVRLVKKGRGGKEATEVSHLGLDADTLAQWLKALKAQLGCGGVVEDAVLVLHGDQRERVAPLLTARGVRKITRG